MEKWIPLSDLTTTPVSLFSPKKEKYMNRIAIHAAQIKITIVDDLTCCKYKATSSKNKWTIWDIIKNISNKCNKLYNDHLETIRTRHSYFKISCIKCKCDTVRTDQIRFSYSHPQKCQKCNTNNCIIHQFPCDHYFCCKCVIDIINCPICEEIDDHQYSCNKCQSVMSCQRIIDDVPQKYIDRYENQGRFSEYHCKFYYPLTNMFFVSLVCGKDTVDVIICDKEFADEFNITVLDSKN